MTAKKRSPSPIIQWERDLIAAYYDYRMREMLEPLYQKFQQWKAGELEHEDLNLAIHQVHRENQHEFRFFSGNRKILVSMIKVDEPWYREWIKKNPPPGEDQLEEP